MMAVKLSIKSATVSSDIDDPLTPPALNARDTRDEKEQWRYIMYSISGRSLINSRTIN